MNKSSSSHTGIVIMVIAVVLAILGYFYVQGGQPAAGNLVADSQNGDVGLAEVSLLNQIQGIKMDKTLFDDPGYKSLVDHTVAIPVQNIGRPNPFAPLPGVSNPNAPVTPGR